MFAKHDHERGRWRQPPALLLYLSSLLLLAPASGGEARSEATRREGTRVAFARLHLAPSVRIEPVSVRELIAQGGQTAIPFDGTVPPLSGTLVTRRLPALWRITVPARHSRSVAVQASYELRGADGQRDQMSISSFPDSPMRVQVVPIAPRAVLERRGATTFEGGVELLMDLREVRFAGEYEGTLIVTVNRL